MPINILEEALEEATEAAGWYEKECKGLGYDFFNAVEAAFDVIEGHTLPLSPMPYAQRNKLNRRETSNSEQIPFRHSCFRTPY